MRTRPLTLISVLLLTAVALAGCASESTPGGSTGDAPPATKTPLGPTTKAASDLALALSDFPAGWQLHGEQAQTLEEQGFKDGYTRTVVKVSQTGASYINFDSYAYIFENTEQAKTYYDKRASEAKAQFSTEPRNAGEESIFWSEFSGSEVQLVLQGNVVWHLNKVKGGAIIDDMPMDRAASAAVVKY